MKNILMIAIITVLISENIFAFSDDRSGEMTAGLSSGYSILTMADYNQFANSLKMQNLNSAYFINGNILFNVNNSLAIVLRGEYLNTITGANNGEFSSYLDMTPIMIGVTGKFNINEAVYLALGGYVGYEWAFGGIQEKTNSDDPVAPAVNNTYGSGFCAQGDAGIYWRMPFDEALALGFTLGLRYASIEKMISVSDSTGDYRTKDNEKLLYSGQAVTNPNTGKTVTFDMSGLNIGIGFTYEL